MTDQWNQAQWNWYVFAKHCSDTCVRVYTPPLPGGPVTELSLKQGGKRRQVGRFKPPLKASSYGKYG